MSFKIRNEIRIFNPPLFFDIVYKVLSKSIRQKKDIKGIILVREEAKLFLFQYDIIFILTSTKNAWT